MANKSKLRDFVLFEYNSDRLNEKGKQSLRNHFSIYNSVYKNPYVKIILTGFSSKPGSEEYNMDLSHARAEEVSAFIEEEFNIDKSRIIVDGKGENKTPQTELAEAYSSNKDNPHHRGVTIEFDSDYVPPPVSEFTQMAIDRSDTQFADSKKGDIILEELEEAFVDFTHKYIPLPENPISKPPSDNADLFWTQFANKVSGTLTGMEFFDKDGELVLPDLNEVVINKAIDKVLGRHTKTIMELSVGSFINLTSIDEVTAERRLFFEAFSEALAKIDSSYQPDLSNFNQIQLTLYNNFLNRVNDLSPLEKYQVGIKLLRLSHIPVTNDDSIISRTSGSTIAVAAKYDHYGQLKYINGNSFDDFGLLLLLVDGKFYLFDPRHPDECPIWVEMVHRFKNAIREIIDSANDKSILDGDDNDTNDTDEAEKIESSSIAPDEIDLDLSDMLNYVGEEIIELSSKAPDELDLDFDDESDDEVDDEVDDDEIDDDEIDDDEIDDDEIDDDEIDDDEIDDVNFIY